MSYPVIRLFCASGSRLHGGLGPEWRSSYVSWSWVVSHQIDLGALGKDFKKIKFEFCFSVSIFHLYFPILVTKFGQIDIEWKIIMEYVCFTYISFEKCKICLS